MTKKYTLTIITKDNQILLGLKKRGFGMGKYNGFGGKVELGETIEEAAAREVFEESNLSLNNLKKIAIINFSWENKNQDMKVYVFHSDDFSGQMEETEEMKGRWFHLTDIPYKKMWDDDKYWFPLFLKGKSFDASFVFDKKDKVIEHKIKLLA